MILININRTKLLSLKYRLLDTYKHSDVEWRVLGSVEFDKKTTHLITIWRNPMRNVKLVGLPAKDIESLNKFIIEQIDQKLIHGLN